ncbi:hypothetical protein N2152v2_006630 [Parachlorella kessleri]
MLHSVNREALKELRCIYSYKWLPCPSIFPNLTSLDLMDFEWDAHWLGQLRCLPQLQDLGLSCSGGHGLLLLPALPALTGLTVRIDSQATLRVVLWPTLPALQKLAIDSRAEVEILAVGEGLGLQGAGMMALGSAGLAARAAAAGAAGAAYPPGSTSCAIHTLELGGSSITVDFGMLPVLESLSLYGCGALAGGSTLAGASALRSLYVDGTGLYGGVPSLLTAVWVTELLRAAPASLRKLHMEGLWGIQQSQVIGGLSQLQMLALDSVGDGNPAAAAAALA